MSASYAAIFGRPFLHLSWWVFGLSFAFSGLPFTAPAGLAGFVPAGGRDFLTWVYGADNNWPVVGCVD